MNFRGAWLPANRYSTRDTVTFGGSTYIAQADNQNQSPDQSTDSWAVIAQVGSQGPTGAAGVDGVSPTITVGRVSALPVGSTPTVANSGTSQAVVLDFGIPQAASGTAGSSGSSQPSSDPLAFFHYVSYSGFLSPNSTVAVATEGTPSGQYTYAWIPKACTVSRLDVYAQSATSASTSLGSMAVTIRLGTSVPPTDTTVACSSFANNKCTITPQLPVAAGSFLDLHVTNAPGNTFVFTSLECDPQ